MLDEKSTAMLSAINELCPGGGFKIVEEQELARAFPDGGDVARTLAYLEEKRLIELRYADEGTYCVRTMPAGRSYAERSLREKEEQEKSRREGFFVSFFGAFLGGAAAALLILLVELIFRV